MKKYILLLIIIFVLFIKPVYGCWVYYSPEEMIDEAEIIALVKFVNQNGIDKSKEFGNTLWKVEVQYYLKGNIEDNFLIISTPGIRDSKVHTSIDYFLSDYNQYMLIFLNYVEGKLTPVTPFGIINLKATGNDYNEKYSLNDNILNLYNFDNNNLRSKEELDFFANYVSDCISITKPSNGNTKIESNDKTLDDRIIYFSITILLILIIAFIIAFRKKLKG